MKGGDKHEMKQLKSSHVRMLTFDMMGGHAT